MGQMERQSLGCGYEPRSDRVHLAMWEPPRTAAGYSGPEPTVCAGYTTSLPEVLETALYRKHWEKGQPTAACGPWTEDTLQALLILDGSFAELKCWATTPSKDGGGAQ